MFNEFERANHCIYSNENTKKSIYIKNIVKANNIKIGEFTYYDSSYQNIDFENENVLYNVIGHGELIIGKFTSIAHGVTFMMGAANHSMQSFSTYPFMTISEDWAKKTSMCKEDMPNKGDTIVGNDVWIGRDARILPGVHIGDGAIIGSYSVVSKDVEPYTIVAGNPIKVIRKRFDEDIIDFLIELKWWNFKPEYLDMAVPYLTSLDLEGAKEELIRIAQLNRAN